MFAYIVRRLAYTVPIIFGIALITFILFNVVGGDPVLMMLGKHADANSIAELHHELGLDRPLWIQFFDNLKQIVTFDFGRSYSTKQEIWSMILRTAPVSLSLTIPAFFLEVVLSIALALLVAFWRGTRFDRFVVVLSVIGMSVSSLAFILFGQYFLAYRWSWFPISGYSSEFPIMFYYLALPIIIWVVVSLGEGVRFYRTVMLDEINQDYVRTARSKGLTEKVILFKHVLKNAMIPVITSVVLQIPLLIAGALLLESFFSIPGMGSMLIDAINSSDYPVIRADMTIFSLLYIIFNLLTDICYALADPRISLR